MSKLRDFQVFARATLGEQKAVNLALFATTEPVRLWLRERRFDAPFQKLLVSLTDAQTASQGHGSVTVVEGVCEISEAVDVEEVRTKALDHRWVLGIVKDALTRVADQTGWRSAELEEHLDALAASSKPLVYSFDKLAARDKASGTECVPWYRSRPGLFEIGVRITRAGRSRDVVVVHSTTPLYLEDSFPLAATRIKDSQLQLLDKNKKPLATVEIEDAKK